MKETLDEIKHSYSEYYGHDSGKHQYLYGINHQRNMEAT
jgi:hypothetical protein